MLRFRRDPISFLRTLGRDHGDIAGFRLATFPAVFVNHPKLVREVLVNQKDNFPKLGRQTKTIASIDGPSLFVRNGESWLSDRKAIQSALHPRHMPAMLAAVDEEVERFVSNWNSRLTLESTDRSPAAQTVDLSEETLRLAICLTGRMILNTSLHEDLEQLSTAAKIRTEVFPREMGAFVRLHDHVPLPYKRRKRRLIETMDRLLYSIIDQRTKNPLGDGDLTSVLIERTPDGPGKRQRIRDNLSMLFHAGVDDVATGMLWMLHEVAHNHSVQSDLRTSLQARPPGGEGSNEHSMNTLSMRIAMEALRRYPPTWIFTSRFTRKATHICGYPVQKKSWVIISPLITQNDPRFFENPGDFDPTRFERHRNGSPERDAWFPFGIGPRSCAGARQSLLAMEKLLTRFFENFELNSLSPRHPDLRAAVTVRPTRPLTATISLATKKQRTAA